MMALLAAVCVLLTGGALMANAQPNSLTRAADTDQFDQYLVKTESPQNGTQVNLFDYWLQDDESLRTAEDYAFSGDMWGSSKLFTVATKNPDGGINKDPKGGSHGLLFSTGTSVPNKDWEDGNASVNGSNACQSGMNGSNKEYPNCSQANGIYKGLVSDTLVNGYPQLQAAGNITNSESLSYLFDDSKHTGKKAFMNTNGLLHVNTDGYYSYDSTQNFASFDEGTKTFKVYDTPAVRNSQHEDGDQNKPFKNRGQFFPFNKPSEVFDVTNDGLEAKDVISSCPGSNGCLNSQYAHTNLNHYFGVSMTTRFVQPQNGKVDSPKGGTQDMVYRFSGDDDVWVYIDDKLVGDLGGIHDKASLEINFADGTVKVTPTNGDTDTTYFKDIFDNADLTDGTFKANTFHTLKFFYLERGNVDSNMSLMFNLKAIPASDILKVDQYGEPVPNASFRLYAANDSYKYDESQLIADGSTGPDGRLILVDEDGYQVNFDQLWQEHQYDHYVLKEVPPVPSGYRAPATEMHLKYVSAKKGTSGVIQSETIATDPGSVWRTGSVASSRELVTISPNNVYAASNTGRGDEISSDDLKNGLLFAVVLKRAHTADTASKDSWQTVTGDSINGWEYKTVKGLDTIAEAIKTLNENGSRNMFAHDANGSYTTTIDDMPGDITKYYWMLDANDRDREAEYAVGYYFAQGVTDVSQVTGNNIKRLYSDEFGRQFGATLHVSDIKNELYVQKINDLGEALDGVTFDLYTENQLRDGQIPEGTKPFDSATTSSEHMNETGTEHQLPHFKGLAAFPSKGKTLPAGTYYLKESGVVDGYQPFDKLVKVTVNQYGVFADAGETGDGVKVARGVGRMLKTVSSFGASPETDNTLTWIKAAPKKIAFDNKGDMTGEDTSPEAVKDMCAASVEDGLIKTEGCSQDNIRLDYAAVDHVLEYGVREGTVNSLFITDTGTPSLHTTQDEKTTDANEHADRANLGGDTTDNPNDDVRLNAVVSGSTLVQVTNQRDNVSVEIPVKKTVEGAAADQDYTFTLTLTNSANAEGIDGLTDGKATATITANALNDENADGTAESKFPSLSFPIPDDDNETTYTFTVTENDTSNPSTGWTYDKSEYKVTVTVKKKDGKWTAEMTKVVQTKDTSGMDLATPSEVDDKTLAFTNSFQKIENLPLTGALGLDRNWLILGGGITLLGLAFALIANRLKRGE